MNLLIVSATRLEIEPLLTKLNFVNNEINNFISLEIKQLKIDFLITGIGLVATTFYLGKILAKRKYDLVINIGIAGSFNRNLQIGEIVYIVKEEFADLGIESPMGFQSLFEAGYLDKNASPFRDGKLHANVFDNELINGLKKVSAITSNTAHGTEKTIDELGARYRPDIESMEGAAFFYVCLMENVNFVQIRAISNYVEKRNKAKWDIQLAINNLSSLIIDFVNYCASH